MRLTRQLSIVLFILLQAFSVSAQKESRQRQFNLEHGVAIQGYDPVAYFTEHKAVKGKKQYAVEAEGITYYLSSQTNKDLFLKAYKAYEPQYGGWCAFAMGSTGEKVEVDPETFKITDGKLFLFYHTWTNNTLPKWDKDERNLEMRADKNWEIIIKK